MTPAARSITAALFAGCFLLTAADPSCAAAPGSPSTCLPAKTEAEVEAEEAAEVKDMEVRLLQAAMSVSANVTVPLHLDEAAQQHRETEHRSFQEARLAKYKEWAAAPRTRPSRASDWTTGKNSFTSEDGLMCFEGQSRGTEGYLALKKAGITGRLFDNVTVQPKTCAERGYTHNGGVDNCDPDVTIFVGIPEDSAEFVKREVTEWIGFGLEYNMSYDTVNLAFDCTCRIGSTHREERGSQCEALYNVPGAWVHHDPSGGPGLVCDGGPFVTATWSLSILKSNPQLPMHLHDRIAATTCAKLGFPHRQATVDHCFPPMYLYYKNPDINQDEGCAKSSAVEGVLYSGSGWVDFLERENMNVDLFQSSRAGCHCLQGSAVWASVSLQCSLPGSMPPIRDWFHSGPEPIMGPTWDE